jgi:prolyl-tRNA editing enzyme YbaK/EbsC (Cys-tRNA(Pro) deacylase)
MTALSAAETSAGHAIDTAPDSLAAYQAATRLAAEFRRATDTLSARRGPLARAVREDRSLSLRKLAEEIGRSPAMAQKLIAGKKEQP